MTSGILIRQESRSMEWMGVLAFAAATAFTARAVVPLPFTPVPLTLQMLSVLMAGLVLGPRLGAASQVAYLAAIAAGLPLTASGLAGPAAFLGPTGGYLLAFVPAAYAVGRLIGPGWRKWGALVAGLIVVYLVGAGWLALWGGFDLLQAWRLGIAPFLLADATKVMVGGLLADGARHLLPVLAER